MTPIAKIAGLKIGSRPSSRTKSSAIEDLRAIPWVFSWAQSRAMLPGWYGTGEGFAAFEDKALLADIARKSVVWGKSVSVRVDIGGRRRIKKKTTTDLASCLILTIIRILTRVTSEINYC